MPATRPSAQLVTVRYFAAAHAATGLDEEQLDVAAGCRVEELAGVLAQRHGPALARVLRAASFLVNETAGPRDRPVPAGGVVDVLPPFAGG